MSTKQKERGTVLTCPECGHSTTAMDKKVTMGVQTGCNSPLKDVSRKISSPPPDAIKRALKRLEMYPKERNGKNSKIK